MPNQSIWMLRFSLIWLLLSVLLGGLLLIHKAISIHPAVWALLPLHFEMAIWGWFVQFVMGTAWWFFPRYLQGSKRGSESGAWSVCALFNTGLVILLISHLGDIHNLLPAAARMIMGTAVFIFVLLIWNRVVTYRHLG